MHKLRIASLLIVTMILLSAFTFCVSAKETTQEVALVGCENSDLGRFEQAINNLSASIAEGDGYLNNSRIYTSKSARRLWEAVAKGEDAMGPEMSLTELENAADDIRAAIDGLVLIENYVIGNVIASDKINVKDATAIQKHLADIMVLGEESLRLADANGDSTINIRDATVIQKYIAGIFVADCHIGQTPNAEPTNEGIRVGDAVYNVSKGSRITYTVELQADRLFENIQAVVKYDSDILELIRIIPDDPDEAIWAYEGEFRCPNLDMMIFNADLEDEIKFNASRIAGFNFKDEKILVTLEFRVKSTAYSEIDFVMEYMTIKGNGTEFYFNEGEPVITEGLRIVERINMPYY